MWLQEPQRSPAHQCCRSRLSALHCHLGPDHPLSSWGRASSNDTPVMAERDKMSPTACETEGEGSVGTGPVQRWEALGSRDSCVCWFRGEAAARAAWQGTKSAFHRQISKHRFSVSTSTALTPAHCDLPLRKTSKSWESSWIRSTLNDEWARSNVIFFWPFSSDLTNWWAPPS